MKKATVDLFSRIFSVLAPPPDMTISQWADEYRRLSSESSAEPGRWRTSKAPYQREIMDAVCDNRVQKVVIMSAAQIGKTDVTKAPLSSTTAERRTEPNRLRTM